MENLGWIKLYRKSKDNPLMRDFTAWGVFTYILLSVNRTSGVMFYGRNRLSEILEMKPTTLRDAIYRLRDKYKVIATFDAKMRTEIRVLNWHKYQDTKLIDAKSNAKATPTQRQGDATIQEVENKELRIIPKGITYGNEDINKIISYMKEKLGLPALDESIQVNRNYANLLLKKFGGVDKIKLLIDATAVNDFWSNKVSSTKKLYYKAVEIISSTRDKKGGVLQL